MIFLEIKCDYCNNPMKELGGLVFSPPDENGMVKKYHACKSCFMKLIPVPSI